MEPCLTVLRSWMITKELMTDDTKREFMIVSSQQQLECGSIYSIKLGGAKVTPVKSVQNLGVNCDSKFGETGP